MLIVLLKRITNFSPQMLPKTCQSYSTEKQLPFEIKQCLIMNNNKIE